MRIVNMRSQCWRDMPILDRAAAGLQNETSGRE